MLVRALLLLILTLKCSFASVMLTDTQKEYADFSISYLYDENSSLSLDQVVHLPFTQTISNQFTLGYKDGTAWFKITLENKSKNRDFILYFSEPFWNDLTLFEPTGDGWIQHKNGLDISLKKRQIEDTNPVFLIHLHDGESKTYFIRGQTHNAQIGEFKIYTDKEFFRPSRLKLNTFYLFYSGVLFIIIILNFFLMLEMRERIYAYYIGYVLSFIVFISMFSSSYLILGFDGWNEGLHTVGSLVLAFMALFSSEFLQLKTFFPKMHTLFKLFTASFFLFGILIYFNVHHSCFTFNLFSAVFLIILLILTVKTWIIGKIQTRYYLIALIIYMPTMALMVLTFNAVLENTDFTRYSFLFGALIEIIFFSLILASRFHVAKYDKIRLQKILLAEKQKNQELLEREVERQQHEIQEKNAILLQQSKNAAMGEMISMIAHQWRQPLNTLALINQDLYFKYQLGQCDKESFEHSHAQFDEHLQHMSKTIDDFRNYYNTDKNKEPENIGEIVKLAIRLSDVFLSYANITLEFVMSVDYTVYLSKNEMVQVLMNLIKNAHDAIVEHHLSEGKITITIQKSNRSVQLLICDNGGGISNDIKEKIFEPYFSTKSKNGTGLGLYMSKTIVEDQCNGSLRFHNTPTGVCFTITLPLAESN